VRKSLWAVLAAILLWGAMPASHSQGTPEFHRRPKLVVIIVIDQFRYDYLERFRPEFVAGGFNRLLEGGANFINCRFDYATTETGPGHATLYTGAYGNMHGIIANTWYDRAAHKPVYCVTDPTTQIVGGPEGTPAAAGASPHNLLADTIGDELRAATDFQSRVIAISLKDRAAVLPGGHTANAAYWYDAQTGHFVTSTYYMHSLPAWVAQFNAAAPTKSFCGKAWEALPSTPEITEKVLAPASGGNNEPCPNPRFLAWMVHTPFMNQVELSFAEAAIDNEHLGHGPATDLLAVSLSVNDFIGHEFGPYSPQVADTTLRTDRCLAAFFEDLDKKVGLANVWIALSADHGVAPTPRYIMAHHLGIGLFRPRDVVAAAQQALSKAFGEDHWIESAEGSSLYLNLSALAAHRVGRAQAESVAAQAAAAVPGVRAAFTRTQLSSGALPDSPLARKVAHSFYPARSGDVFIVLAPYAVPSSSLDSTKHGSPWNYDAQVPMIFWGSAFKPGTYAVPCQTIDLAPSLAAVLGLTQPSDAQGKPLTIAIR
jgi:predicted AlkP superfamily pyrophosphatase or phosphodiesterase